MIKKKKILILNGSHSEIPLILSAKKKGLKVITTGNNSSLIGHSYADEYIKCDFSDKDKILDIAINKKISFICAPAHDLGLLSAAYVAEKLNLPGYDNFDTSQNVHHKDKFKFIAKQINLKTPENFSSDLSYNAIQKKSNFSKFIIKPIDMGGGLGISIIDNVDLFKKGIKKAFSKSLSQNIVIEKFVDGSLHSLTTYIKNKKIVFSHHDDELTYKNPFQVYSSMAPGSMPYDQINSAKKELELFANHLNLVDGVLHAQIISNKSDFFIIELTRRCSGDLYPIPVELKTGVPWSDIIIKSYMGEDVIFKNQFNKNKTFWSRHCLSAKKNGLNIGIYIDKKIKKNIYDKIIFLNDKEIVDDFENKKFGVYIMNFDSKKEMIDKMQDINNLIFVKT